MKDYPANYKLKVFDLNLSKLTEHNLYVERNLHTTNGNIIWKTKFDFNGEVIENENEYFLSESINRIREKMNRKALDYLLNARIMMQHIPECKQTCQQEPKYIN